MKRKIFLFIGIFALIFSTFSIPVNAQSDTALSTDESLVTNITNLNGIEMTEEQYQYLSNFYTENAIMDMTQDKFNAEMNKRFTKTDTTEKYIKTVTYIDSNGNPTTNDYEVSEQEYNNPIIPRANNCTEDFAVECWETTYKKLYMIIWGWGSNNIIEEERIVLMNEWKIMPSVRSYDVIGVRYYNWQPTTAWGDQTAYSYDEGVNTTEYSYNGSNMNIQSNGIGISQNLYDYSSLYGLTNRLVVEGKVLSDHIGRYGSYQHATQSVTLAQSKNYTFGNGMGEVFLFNSGIGSYYDNMQGVSNSY